MKPYDPATIEKDILAFWKKNKIYEKQKKRYASSKKTWSFIDGPMTANNPMGSHIKGFIFTFQSRTALQHT